MAFFAHHGCFNEEQAIGTQFVVDLHVDADVSRASDSDNIRDAVNYQTLYDIVKKEMDTPSHLLEHVAGRIARSTMEKMAKVEQVTVRVAKLNPPLGGQVQQSSVCITCKEKGAIA